VRNWFRLIDKFEAEADKLINRYIYRVELEKLRITIWTADSPRWTKRSLKLEINHVIENIPAPLLVHLGSILASETVSH